MSHRDGRVTLSAWVDPVVRDHARFAAKSAGVEFSKWIERAVQRAVAAELERLAQAKDAAGFLRWENAMRDFIDAADAIERGEHEKGSGK